MKMDTIDDREKSSSELRKINKPLVERRRRERINVCLEELKSLILDVTKRDSCRYSKLEKADVLEMTVRHLKDLQRQQISAAMASDVTVSSRYRAGFSECANEVTNYLKKTESLESETQSRLVKHLTACVGSVNPVTSPVAVPSATPFSQLPGFTGQLQQMTQGVNFPSGVLQLVPATLPSGQVALVVPQATNGFQSTPLQNTNSQLDNRTANSPQGHFREQLVEPKKKAGLSVRCRNVPVPMSPFKTDTTDQNGNLAVQSQNQDDVLKEKEVPLEPVWRPW